MAIDYTTLNIDFVRLINTSSEAGLFRIELGDQCTEGPNAIEVRFLMKGTPAVATLQIGISESLSCNWHAYGEKSGVLQFLMTLAGATVAQRLPAMMNAVSRFLGDDTVLPMGVESLAFVWNETAFEWTFPDGIPDRHPANDVFICIERCVVASVLFIMDKVLDGNDPAFNTALQWLCTREAEYVFHDGTVTSSSPATLHLVPPVDD